MYGLWQRHRHARRDTIKALSERSIQVINKGFAMSLSSYAKKFEQNRYLCSECESEFNYPEALSLHVIFDHEEQFE